MTKKTVLRKIAVTAGLVLFMAPIYVFLGAWLCSDDPGVTNAPVAMWVIFPSIPLVFSLSVRLMQGKLRRVCTIIMLAITLFLTAGAAVLMDVPGIPAKAGLMLIALALYLIHLKALTKNAGDEYPSALWYGGIALYLLAQWLLRGTLNFAWSTVQAASLGYLLFLLLEMNRFSLAEGVGDDQEPSRRMVVRNRIMIGIIYLAAVLLANIKQLANLMSRMWRAVKHGIVALCEMMLRIFNTKPAPSSDAPQQEMGGFTSMEIAEPSLVMQILEKVFICAAFAVFAVVLFFALKKLCQLMKKAVLLLMEKYRNYMNQVAEAYEDQVESIADWKEMREKAISGHRTKKRRKIQWEKLDPREKVRQCYWLWMQKNRVTSEKTASGAMREKRIEPSAGEIYDEARYSSMEITEENADKFMKYTNIAKGGNK